MTLHHSLKSPLCSCVPDHGAGFNQRRSRDVQRAPQPCCLKEKREHHCHPTARAPSRASLSSDRPRSLFLALLKKVKTILVHCAHRLLSKLARILCTLRTRPFARASRSRCQSHRKRESQRCVNGLSLRSWRNSKRLVRIRRSSARSSAGVA